ncbi:DNA internalization-related competence protein ComEC/Rec2 [bacterium]|nr:DNA internalization-related competence protein ComEC/Rec2 [bacterium]
MLKVIRSNLHNLFIPCLFWLLGIVIASKYSYHNLLNLLVLGCFVMIFFSSKLRIYFIFSLFTLIAWFYSTSYYQLSDNDIRNYITPQKPIEEVFLYKVTEVKQTSKEEKYYIAEIRRLADYQVKGKVLIFGLADTLKVNHIYKTPLKLSEIEKPHNPGEFDFHRYYKHSGIGGQAIPLGITEFIRKEETCLQSLKTGVVSKLERTFPKNKAMVLALFLGDKGGLQINQDELSEMGLIHLFAVSGLHVGIIYLSLLSMINILIKLDKARILASLVLIFYGFLCGWTPSVARTIIIIITYNTSLVLQRKISFLQLLSITLFIITVSNPYKIFSVGLHLSLTAFIALWIANRHLVPFWYRIRKKYKLPHAGLIPESYLIYSMMVILFIAPLSAYYFNIISLNAIITNILATPIVTLMLNIIFFSLLIPQNIFLQKYLAETFDFLNYLFTLLINFAEELPFFTRTITLTGVELIFIILTIFGAIILFRKKKRWAVIFISIASVLLILKVYGVFTTYHDQVICFDAGNADCSYLEFADKRNILIDTGSEKQAPFIIKSSLLPYLRKRHISSINSVIITHPHEDHYGGLFLLAQNMKIGQVIIHRSALQDDNFAKIIKELDSQIRITVVQDTLAIWDQKIKFLHPHASYASENMNNNSLVTMINYGKYTLLFTGDIEEEAENKLVEGYGNRLKADFLKVAHHGSISSSNGAFLDKVAPSKCFIPAGNRDKDKFPNPTIVKRLKDRNIITHIGNQDGAIIIKP